MDSSNILTALDIGTSKVAALVAEKGGGGTLRVLGLGLTKTHGMDHGAVKDVNGVVGSIHAALEEVEKTSGIRVREVCTAVGDSRIEFMNHAGAVPVRGAEIVPQDIEYAFANAREPELKGGSRVLKILLQEYAVDGEGGIRKPVGLAGNRLEAKVHMACGMQAVAQNLLRCVKKAGVGIEHWYIPAWVTAGAVLEKAEKDLGVCLMDFGAGTVDMTVFVRGGPWFTKVIPFGGELITRDVLAFLKSSSLAEAEEIKVRYGSADRSRFTVSDIVDISALRNTSAVQGRIEAVSQAELAQVVYMRLEEMLGYLNEVLMNSGFGGRIASGLVFTGGVSRTDGFIKVAEKVFGRPCRLGNPNIGHLVGGTSNAASWAVAAGILRQASLNPRLGSRSGEGRSRAGGLFGFVRRFFVGGY